MRLSQRVGKVGFVGAGQMATALARGLATASLVQGQDIIASDPSAEARERFAGALPGALVLQSNQELAGKADVLVLAVKPQQMDDVLAELRSLVQPEMLVVSIAAGITLERLARGLSSRTKLARVMPNTPCLIGRGASAFSLSQTATATDRQFVTRLLEGVGIVHEVPEEWLDTVTGLSGSGPAFVYTVIEALTEGGVAMGLPGEMAAALASQTVWGAAEMVVSSGDTPDDLRRRVMSPGGTTVAGMEELERRGFKPALQEAVRAATLRSRELGRYQ